MIFRALLSLLLLSAFTLHAQGTTPSTSPALLQLLLDRSDFITYDEDLPQVDAAALSAPQRLYFKGMFAFHIGRLTDAIPMLTEAANTNDHAKPNALTSAQVLTALETLGQIFTKQANDPASAAVYNGIDKIFGARLGEGEESIKDNRHLANLLKSVPPLTVQFSGDFTLRRGGLEYPVSIAGHSFSAEFDTGAEISVLSASTARAWGVTLLEGTAKLHGYGGGAFQAEPGFVPVLTIGKAELHNVAVYVTPDENLYVAPVKRQTNALLGFPGPCRSRPPHLFQGWLAIRRGTVPTTRPQHRLAPVDRRNVAADSARHAAGPHRQQGDRRLGSASVRLGTGRAAPI